MSWNGVEIVHVAAMDTKNCIGVDNRLPWHFPADLKHFKQITQGGVIVMGRKTFDSLGRLLPNRSHWVLTRDKDWTHEDVHVVQTLDELLKGATTDAISRNQSSIYVIGGGELFNLTLPFADQLEITHVELDVEGDAYHPEISSEWISNDDPKQIDPESNITFRFATYRKTA